MLQQTRQHSTLDTVDMKVNLLGIGNSTPRSDQNMAENSPAYKRSLLAVGGCGSKSSTTAHLPGRTLEVRVGSVGGNKGVVVLIARILICLQICIVQAVSSYLK